MAIEVSEQKKDNQVAQWPSWLGVLFVLIAFVSSQFLAYILLSIYGSFRHWTSAQTASWLSDQWQAQFFYILIAEAVVVGSICLFASRYKRGLRTLGLRKPKWSDIGYALMIAPAYFIVYILLAVVVSTLVPGFDLEQQQDIGFTNVHGTLAMMATFISLVILPPIAEELMARGLLYSSFKKVMPMIWAAIVTSIFFAVPHLLESSSGGLLFVAGLDTFVLSMFLVYLREKTDGLWSPMVLHAIKNSVAFVALFVLATR